MSSLASTANPFLVAILLVCNTRTGSGAQIVYHYPPDPLNGDQESVKSTSSYSEYDDSDDTSTTSSDSLATDDELPTLSRGVRRLGDVLTRARTKSISDEGDSLVDKQSDRAKPSVNHLFGFAVDGLVSLLAPERTWHKRKFELGINDFTFVGRPAFVRHDGSWVKRKRAKRNQTRSAEPISDTASGSEDDVAAIVEPQEDVPAVKDKDTTQLTRSQLIMFHVVFVMNPPPIEQNARVKEMYDHVIKKLSRALRWEQVHNDYVFKQSEIITGIKTSANAKRMTRSQLYADIAERSSLAVALSTIYNAISRSRIASITLSPKVSLSLQIPPITSTANLPALTDPPIPPGLWLTTATDIGSAMADSVSGGMTAAQVAKHYTLLLKAPPQRIAKDAQDAGGSLAQHLPRFLSALRPTKSFYKLSMSSRISLTDIQTFAQHLIYWRRAVAIPPLHQRDTYIVSPNADMRKLKESMRAYESQFPATMPSLPKMLSALSGIPRPFGTLIPSSDHKELYYFALAWLMRNGWVTQLRTFALVRVDPAVKRHVREADRDARSQITRSKLTRRTSNEDKDTGRTNKSRPRLTSNPSSDGRKSLESGRIGSNARTASIVLNPPRASSEESKWLEYIHAALQQGNDPELALTDDERADLHKYWPALVKYFDGRVALETVPVRENLKRKFVWNLLEKIGLVANRGLTNDDKNKAALLLTIRHW